MELLPHQVFLRPLEMMKDMAQSLGAATLSYGYKVKLKDKTINI